MKKDLQRHVEALAGSRYWSAPGFGLALDYSEECFRSWGFRTYRQEFEVKTSHGGPCHNLIADLASTGGGAGGPEIIVGAHLDSISREAPNGGPAPGADDNASGCAIVLEAARVVAQSGPGSKIRFILFGAEEVGLHGSRAYVAAIGAERETLRAAWILDQVGLQTRERPTLKLEGYKRLSGALMQAAEKKASDAGLLTVRTYHPYGSDHMPFLEAKIPALLLIQPDDEDDPLNHTTGDTPERLDYDYMERVLRLVSGVLIPTPPR